MGRKYLEQEGGTFLLAGFPRDGTRARYLSRKPHAKGKRDLEKGVQNRRNLAIPNAPMPAKMGAQFCECSPIPERELFLRGRGEKEQRLQRSR